MRIRDMKPEAQRNMLENLLDKLVGYFNDNEDLPEDMIEDFLIYVLRPIEKWSQEDMFGTEGWKHYFGYEE